MKPKTVKILYWTVTGLFSLFLLMAGITEAMQHESGRQIMQHLGYPVHVMLVIGIGKILAALALIQTRYRVIKEWAYAGVTFNLIGAFAARANAGDSTGLILSPLIFLSVMFLSYFLWKKVAKATAAPLHPEPQEVKFLKIA
ncbi:DoxX family protein [Adhaeribacter radiodurans]|uniref:DoxX family protein n=1 Tax=Adhaeribacter radiodurans TaxID=2745197 RepID=A0A7L7L930_9BACT|nr:DoxX family protein [Adhaeribacter radiodurans]QMU29015.1 DoxX family protein [Adhaeribacter radiodurans]